MVGGLLFHRRYFFACGIALLHWACLRYVEASSGKRVIHKEVGGTVELSSGLPTEGVTAAIWKYGYKIVADNDTGVSKSSQFKDRSELNSKDFTLTVRKLTLQDSGDFIFVSAVNEKQRETVTITLQVHEPITKPPVIKINSTWIASDKSCKVLLECSATGNVTYNWTVGNQTLTGSKQQYTIREEDGETTFTCTVSNYVNEKSESGTVTCSNSTQQDQIAEKILFVSIVVGSLMLIIIFIIILGVWCCKKKHAGSDTNDLTVYADIGEITSEDAASCTMTPCSVYETIDNRASPVKSGPQTVYDKIQLNRVRKASVSPYQEVS